ncbi:AMP-binding protein [Solirubrobacter soli]|uniref:AMP-binding protein n=1 Tax=Solirubrobacter soli TaxID=363832 RepID=UPI000424927C|nr:AMP-binding protein [Solirubrobacter soli]
MHLSYVRGGTDVPLLAETIGARLRATTALFPDCRAVPGGVTYAELWRDVDHAARALIASGVYVGDRVGVSVSDRYEALVARFAAVRVGAIVVSAHRGDDLAKAGVTVLFHAGGPIGRCREMVSLDRGWERFLAAGPGVSPVEALTREFHFHPDDPALIVRGATYTHRALVNRTASVLRSLDDPGVAVLGRVPPWVEVKIVDAYGDTVPRGVVGEQWTRGYHVMLGHWNERAAVVDPDGWLHTGEVCVMDADDVVSLAWSPAVRVA